MCLITKQKKPTKLTKDLTVYKKVDLINNVPHSAHNNFKWEINKLYSTKMLPSTEIKMHDELVNDCYSLHDLTYEYVEKEKLKILKDKKLVAIGHGFHSAKNIDRFIYGCWGRNVFVECTIPKGSLIYKDKTGLIVSNQIIMNKILK